MADIIQQKIDQFEYDGDFKILQNEYKPKEHFYYGLMYHKMFDPKFEEARQKTLDIIKKKSSVLDIGCGTGQLCFELREQKQCRVVGIDLSLRMIDFSKKSNPFKDVRFVHEDATDLSSYEVNSFDYVTMLMVLHELDPLQQNHVLAEVLRVGKMRSLIY